MPCCGDNKDKDKNKDSWDKDKDKNKDKDKGKSWQTEQLYLVNFIYKNARLSL